MTLIHHPPWRLRLLLAAALSCLALGTQQAPALAGEAEPGEAATLIILSSLGVESSVSVVVALEQNEPAGAADASAEPLALSLRELVSAAVEHSPGLAALQWQAIAAWEQSESVAGHGGLSSELSLTAMRTNSPLGVFGTKLSQGRVTQQDFDPLLLNDPDFLGNVETKLVLAYPLFDNGRIKLLSDAVALNANAIDYDALAREHELIASVIEAYFNHALLGDQLAVLEDAQLTVDELTRMIEQLHEEGLVIGSDLAAANVQQANLADEINRAVSQRSLIEQTLSVLTGGGIAVPFTSKVPLELTALPAPAIEEQTAVALTLRPELEAMRLRVYARTNMLNEAIKRRNPVVGLFAAGANNSPQVPFGGDGHSEFSFGAQLTLDLDTGGVIRNEVDQKRAELQAAQLGLQQLEELAQVDVAQAHSAVVIAKQSIETFTTQADRAAENLRVVRNRYREGLTNFLDLRMAVTLHKESRLRQVKARHDYLLAYLQLLVATGQLNTEADPFLYEPVGRDAASADSGGDEDE